MWRADSLHWSVPFLIGTWASAGFHFHRDPKTNPPWILRDGVCVSSPPRCSWCQVRIWRPFTKVPHVHKGSLFMSHEVLGEDRIQVLLINCRCALAGWDSPGLTDTHHIRPCICGCSSSWVTFYQERGPVLSNSIIVTGPHSTNRIRTT